MKKIILFFSAILMFTCACIGTSYAESVMEPQWGEFCPPMYENAVFKPGAKSVTNVENNYWALRKVKFQKSIAECKAISRTQAELNTCFSRVANIEQNKTAQRKEAKIERNSDQDREIRDSNYWWY